MLGKNVNQISMYRGGQKETETERERERDRVSKGETPCMFPKTFHERSSFGNKTNQLLTRKLNPNSVKHSS